MPALTLKERLAALKARNPELFQENRAEQNKAQEELAIKSPATKRFAELDESTEELLKGCTVVKGKVSRTQRFDVVIDESDDPNSSKWLPFTISTQSVAYLAARQLCLYEEVPEELSRLANDFDFAQQTQSNHYIELLYQLDNYFSRG